MHIVVIPPLRLLLLGGVLICVLFRVNLLAVHLLLVLKDIFGDVLAASLSADPLLLLLHEVLVVQSLEVLLGQGGLRLEDV
jgi:hypothetical protein